MGVGMQLCALLAIYAAYQVGRSVQSCQTTDYSDLVSALKQKNVAIEQESTAKDDLIAALHTAVSLRDEAILQISKQHVVVQQ
jgi:hypothetical protein